MILKVIFVSFMFLTLYGPVYSQEKYPVKQLTFDSAQEGFPSWSPDGKSIVYSYISFKDSLKKNGLWVTTFDEKEPTHIFSGIVEHPKWSPNGRFIVYDADSGKNIRMLPAEGGAPIDIIPDSIKISSGGGPIFSPNGDRIAFMESPRSNLWILDINTRKTTKIFHQEGTFPIPGCWSRDGKSVLIALRDKQSRISTMWKISYDGKDKKEITGIPKGFHRFLDVSPDGLLITCVAFDGKNFDIWIIPSEGGKPLRLTSHPAYDENPIWSPDGKKIAFTSTRSGNHDVWVMGLDIEQIKKELKRINE
jgi:TolB protein